MKKLFIVGCWVLLILLVSKNRVVEATPMVPSLRGNKGLYRVMSADLGYPGIVHARLGFRMFTSDLSVHYPLSREGRVSIDTSGKAIDSYFGSDFDYAFSWAVTKRIEISVRGRYKGDFIDCDDSKLHAPGRPRYPYQWYFHGTENRASGGRGDADIGIKFIVGKFLRPSINFAAYPFVSIPTGDKQNRENYYDASFFGRRTISNRGGVFRYFTNGAVAPGILLLWSGSTKTQSPLSGYLNLGYQVKKAGELLYGLGMDIFCFDYFDPFIEFWGSRRSFGGKDPFGDHPPGYISLGLKFVGTGISADFVVDFLALGKRVYDFRDFLPEDSATTREKYVATGWGVRPTWAVNLGIGYSYDFSRMAPITTKGVIMGRVTDATSKQGIDAIVSVTGAPRMISDPLTGTYDVKADAGKARVIVSKKGYESKTHIVMLNRGDKVILDFELEPIVRHGAVTGKTIDKWTTKPVEGVEVTLIKDRGILPGGREVEPGTITKTVGDDVYKLNPKTGTWELTPESVGEEEITTIIDGKLHKLNLVTGEWEIVKGASTPLQEEEITTIIDGELYRLNVITGNWEKVEEGVKFENMVQEGDVVESIDGELHKLNLTTGTWEKIKVPSKSIEQLADTLSTTNIEGLYRLDLVPEGTHFISAQKGGYITQISPVVCKSNEASVLNFELYAERIILRGVHFEFDKSELLVDSYPILEKLYEFLKTNPEIRVEIGGHTCSIASDDYNLKLSDARANVVRNYLLKHGIESERITARGYGESMPITDNETEEGKQLNRRIEMTILKD